MSFYRSLQSKMTITMRFSKFSVLTLMAIPTSVSTSFTLKNPLLKKVCKLRPQSLHTLSITCITNFSGPLRLINRSRLPSACLAESGHGLVSPTSVYQPLHPKEPNRYGRLSMQSSVRTGLVLSVPLHGLPCG